MAEEPVIAPDQLKPGHGRSARIGAVVTVVALLLMLIGNHSGKVENLWLLAGAALIVAILVVDWRMRKNGLRR